MTITDGGCLTSFLPPKSSLTMFYPSLQLVRICKAVRMYSTLPVIDFGRFLAGSTKDRKLIASEVDHALKTVGFFYIRNYDIPQSRINNCFD
jgi:non-haem dioxygenase in morphine synthesis N-terminal